MLIKFDLNLIVEGILVFLVRFMRVSLWMTMLPLAPMMERLGDIFYE
jgi:hypothetical protein|tara:strand:- start:254 stop:394 length:141 start_codon:yes stop_codon:yes gene_type:complete